MTATESLGFQPAETDLLLCLTAAVLHLGNIAFVDTPSDGGGYTNGLADPISVLDSNPLSVGSAKYAAKLLGIREKDLIFNLSYRSRDIRGERTWSPLTSAVATETRNALAQTIFSRLFDWLVGRINDSLEVSGRDAGIISVLDIFGFEIFEKNSFEQVLSFLQFVAETY